MYRTYTYIAADFDHDFSAVERILCWNDSYKWSMSFKNVHDKMQSRDSSLYCSIKKSLKERMDISNTFVLIVGDHTKTITKGACYNCLRHRNSSAFCSSNMFQDYRSYIEYECQKAIDAEIRLVILYNSNRVERNKCPEILRYKGTHVAMKSYDGAWDYFSVKNAILGNRYV